MLHSAGTCLQEALPLLASLAEYPSSCQTSIRQDRRRPARGRSIIAQSDLCGPVVQCSEYPLNSIQVVFQQC